jgi:glycosyltransferase involved in cell wall biosynthesis
MRDLRADPTPPFRVSVVIPARNEANNLPHVFQALPAGLHEVILVDGHSTDRTIEVARALWPDVKIVQQTRRGKGNALACGFAQVTGDVVVLLDADGSADPREIPAFVAALAAGADFAKGTRFDGGGCSHDITRFRRVGNAGLNRLVNLLFRTHYTDLCYGYNAFRSYLLPVLDLPPVEPVTNSPDTRFWGDGFEIETLINVRAALAGVRIIEVGSIEFQRLHGVSNLRAIPDGIRVLRTILAERRRRPSTTRDSVVRDSAWYNPALVRDTLVPDSAAPDVGQPSLTASRPTQEQVLAPKST